MLPVALTTTMDRCVAIHGIIGNIHTDNPEYDESGRGWKRSYWIYPKNDLFNTTVSNRMWTWFSLKKMSIEIGGLKPICAPTQEQIDALGNRDLVFSATVKHGMYGTIEVISAAIVGVCDED